MRTAVTLLSVMAMMGGIVGAQSNSTPLTGAWRIVEVTTTGPNAATNSHPQPGLHLFTGKYYSIVVDRSESPRPEVNVSTASEAELVAMWRPFTAQAGTYEISGTTFTIHHIVAKNAGNVGPENFDTFSFKLEGTTLWITSVSSNAGPYKNPTTIKLTRVD